MLGRAYGDDHDEETREAIQEQINTGERLRQVPTLPFSLLTVTK